MTAYARPLRALSVFVARMCQPKGSELTDKAFHLCDFEIDYPAIRVLLRSSFEILGKFAFFFNDFFARFGPAPVSLQIRNPLVKT